MSFQALYSDLVGNINRESNQMECFSQLNYDWLELIVDKMGLRNVKVMRKSLSPVPQIIAAPEIVEANYEDMSFEESSLDDEEFCSLATNRVTFPGIEGASDSDDDRFETVAKTRIGNEIWDSLDEVELQVPMTAPIPRKRAAPELIDDSESGDEPMHTIRFVDSRDLRMSIDPTAAALLREENDVHDNVSDMLSQLSTSAAQFREKWKGIVEEKNLGTRSENQNTEQTPQ